ncbi:hypothetical protein ABZW44_39705 [Streptomyces mirabilis]|uniref:hypothetical protein n=1 Tax=Streptomyces mirabilis TaxID=68239 RepID=UPI0033B7F743
MTSRLEPYRDRLMFLGMVLLAAAIVSVPSVLIPAVPVWTVAVAGGVQLLVVFCQLLRVSVWG